MGFVHCWVMSNGSQYEVGNYSTRSLRRAISIRDRIGGPIWVRRVDGFGRSYRLEVVA